MLEILEHLSINVSSDTQFKLGATLVIILLLWLLKKAFTKFAQLRHGNDLAKYHGWRRVISYVYGILLLLMLGRIWIHGLDSLATFLGLVSAGLAIAMHDTIANLTGWIFIVTRRPFQVGNRIEIGGLRGDVIDIRPFQFSMVEIGNWIDSDQSTGRILNIPNSKVLRDPLANYEIGFEYIWHEVPVLITFESDWEKAKALLTKIAMAKTEHLSEGAEEQIRLTAMRYLIYFNKLTPYVYTTVKDSGVLLTMRYIVKPRNRRGSEQQVWEEILRTFKQHDDIDLAYPTTRFYQMPPRSATGAAAEASMSSGD